MGQTELGPADRFAVTDGRPLLINPLQSESIRFNPILKLWRLYVLDPPNGVYVKTIERSKILCRYGVSEADLTTWETAFLKAGFAPCPFAHLDVGDDGAVLLEQPLQSWNYAYYPSSRLWRRTRSHRDEVSPDKVAKRVGVPLPLIRRWEVARLAQVSSGLGKV
jgi:hypothetical protein